MIRRLLLVAAAAALASCDDLTSPDWQLEWQDEFDGAVGTLPSALNWKADTGTNWGNNQLEYDTERATNASLDGAGHLVITARQEAYRGSAYTSARLTTQGLREQTRGKIEARIKLPFGAGIWPAFWMLGATQAQVGWPATGEIDILENFGRQPGTVVGSLHGPGYSGANAISRSFTLDNNARLDAAYHVFTVEWTVDRIDWFVDGVIYQRVKRTYPNGPWVFDHPFYIIMNLAVGGGPVGPPGGVAFPVQMLVDYVRVYR